LKIASSGRGALAGTRWAHFNCNDKKAKGHPELKASENIDIMTKAREKHREE
jgi:hypothetical protein